jgi:hypothetical protein
LIDSDHGLLAEMITADCISLRQKQFIESGTSSADRNSRLLDILRRGSESDFNKFIECLSKTGQQHVASILHGRRRCDAGRRRDQLQCIGGNTHN